MPQQRSKGNRRVAARLSDRHGIVFGKSAAVTYSTKVMSVTSTETTTAASIFDFAAARHRVGEACKTVRMIAGIASENGIEKDVR